MTAVTSGQRLEMLKDIVPGLTNDTIGGWFGLTGQAVQKWTKSEVPRNRISVIVEKTGVSEEWLVLGRGEPFQKNAALSIAVGKDADHANLIPPQQTVQILPKGVHPTDTHQRIEIYDVRLAAGPEGKGSTVEWIVRPEDDPLYFRHGWFKARRLTAGNLRAMYVRGDSMEPYLCNHDTIIIDTTDTELSDGEVYAIAYNGHMLVKELRATPDGVRIISRNPAYDPIEYQGGEGSPDFQILGRIVWRGG